MDQLTRRTMLQLLGAGGLAALLEGVGPLQTLAGGTAGEPLELDVAIVGAGVAGAYTAWRLLTGDPSTSATLRRLLARHPGRPLRVGLFETSGRVGGRLYSVYPPGMPHLPAEIGGMRIPDTHIIVQRLVQQLGLQTALFPTSYPNNLAYLRGHRLRNSDFAHPSLVPYVLSPNERGKDPVELLVQAIDTVVPGGTSMSQRQWDAMKPHLKFGNRRLQDVGWWEVLERTLGSEGYALVHEGFAYDSFFEQYNAADLMAYLAGDFAPIPTYHRVRRGYQSLPLELAARFHRAGGQVFLHHRLRRLDRSAIDGEPTIRLEVQRTVDGRRVDVEAHHVVLTQTRHAIQLLDPASFIFRSEQFRRDVDAITPTIATRIFLGFREPWWKRYGLVAGRSVTDMPMRMCFYWGTEGDQPGADPHNQNSLFFASYAEGLSGTYWGEFLDHPPQPGTHRPFTAPRVPLVQRNVQAPRPAVDEVMRQVRQLHGPDIRIPDPYTALYVDWAQDPFGASWHLWNVYARSGEVIARMRRPIPDANLHIAGDTWSTDPGWVRGALNTAERVLEGPFDLPRPHWLPPDVYLGP